MLKLKQYHGSIEISKFIVQKPPITSPIYHCMNRPVPNICRAQVDILPKRVDFFFITQLAKYHYRQHHYWTFGRLQNIGRIPRPPMMICAKLSHGEHFH